MSLYFDAHCHLTNAEPFDAVFARAQGGGIAGCVLNSVSPSDWGAVVKISKQYEMVIGAIGIHPWISGDVPSNWYDDMDIILGENPQIIVGESGLDKTRGDWNTQERFFIQELELAIKHNRTINLHCVHAWNDMSRILKSYSNKLPKIIMHSFDGTKNAIDFDANIYFSFSPNVANPNYKKVHESLTQVPKNKILVESDSDDFTKTIIAANSVVAVRNDITADDIFNNAMGVFINDQAA